MTQSTISAADRKKYADYAVEFRQGKVPARPAVWDGLVVRTVAEYRRVPSDRKFIVYFKQGLTADERAGVTRAGLWLPMGGWALHRDCWFRHRAGNGQVYFGQIAGRAVTDPIMQLELEMMIDSTTSVAA